MQAQGIKISDLQREKDMMLEQVRHIESNRKWSEISDVMQRAVWLHNECKALEAISSRIVRESQEQVRQKLLSAAHHSVKYFK